MPDRHRRLLRFLPQREFMRSLIMQGALMQKPGHSFEEETIKLGRRIARELPRRAVVLLIVNLGAGKYHARPKGMSAAWARRFA